MSKDEQSNRNYSKGNTEELRKIRREPSISELLEKFYWLNIYVTKVTKRKGEECIKMYLKKI